jgi:hypothetical protein
MYYGDGRYSIISSREKRWDPMLETADATRQFIQIIVEIIGRKTSEEYAAITIRNLIKKLQPIYPFLSDIEIKNARYMELERCVSVRDTLNMTNPKYVGIALKELVKIIMKSLGKTPGYFFIRETRDKIGTDYDMMLMKTMGVDLTLMQSTYIVEKKSIALLQIEKSDVIRRFLKTLIEVLEKQTSKSFAITFIAQRIDALRQQYPFLAYISINDIRYTLGSEEVAVQSEINTVDSRDLGRAIKSILYDMDKTLTYLGRNSVTDDLKTHLTMEYLVKLEEMGVIIAEHQVGYDAIFKEVIKTLIDIIGKTSTENYAILTVNSFLRKIDSKYTFLKQVKVEPATNQGELYHIRTLNNLDTVSETDTRRAIQHLLEIIMDSLGEKASSEFIQKFKSSIEKKYLSKIEEIGVNFHMIELHQEMLTQKE